MREVHAQATQPSAYGPDECTSTANEGRDSTKSEAGRAEIERASAGACSEQPTCTPQRMQLCSIRRHFQDAARWRLQCGWDGDPTSMVDAMLLLSCYLLAPRACAEQLAAARTRGSMTPLIHLLHPTRTEHRLDSRRTRIMQHDSHDNCAISAVAMPLIFRFPL